MAQHPSGIAAHGGIDHLVMPEVTRPYARQFIFWLALSVVGLCLCLVSTSKPNTIGRLLYVPRQETSRDPGGLLPNSLCERAEHIVFSCTIKRPAKIVSLCASKDLSKERGYLQYRFGLPGKIELEFPRGREKTQQAFRYMHYFRAQVDMTEINFVVDRFEYSVFDDYNGEEKRVIADQGVRVTAPGKGKEVTLVCGSKAKVAFDNLQDILPTDQQ